MIAPFPPGTPDIGEYRTTDMVVARAQNEHACIYIVGRPNPAANGAIPRLGSFLRWGPALSGAIRAAFPEDPAFLRASIGTMEKPN
jgi:hypothetical protein